MSTWTHTLAALGAAAVLAGCTCRPDVPPPPPDETDEPEETGETAHTADTAPPPPCTVPEVEPNDDPTTAFLLPTEQQACGSFGTDGDFDWWEFEVDDSGWLAVELEAGPGSISDVSLLVLPIETDEGTAWAAGRDNDQEATDAHLLFPAPRGTYSINVAEEQLKSGERYLYELLVSEAKAPVTWTIDEVEPNDTQGEAQVLLDGDTVFARADDPTDFDWYQVAVPSGKHVVTLDLDAFPEGSIGDFTFVLRGPGGVDAPGCGNACEITREAPGLLDPYTDYDSSGDETLFIQVLEASNQFGPAAWYTLSVTVEEG